MVPCVQWLLPIKSGPRKDTGYRVLVTQASQIDAAQMAKKKSNAVYDRKVSEQSVSQLATPQTGESFHSDLCSLLISTMREKNHLTQTFMV